MLLSRGKKKKKKKKTRVGTRDNYR